MEEPSAARRRRQLAGLAGDRLGAWRSLHTAVCPTCGRRPRWRAGSCVVRAALWHGRSAYRHDGAGRLAFDAGWDGFVGGSDVAGNPHALSDDPSRHWAWNAGWGWAQLVERALGRRPFPVADELVQAGLGSPLPPGLT